MKHNLKVSFAVLLATGMLLSAAAQGQTFKVNKMSIGGDGGTDYILAEPGTGRVFISRGTHFMVVDGKSGKVLGDIPDTPGTHGSALAPKWHHGFITDGGDSTVTMFDLETLAVIKKIPVAVGGLDGIMYSATLDRVILTDHSRPIGTAVALDPKTGEITGTAQLSDTAPEGAATDSKGRIFINLEGKNAIEVVDAASMQVVANWPIPDCSRPTGIAYDKASNRIFSGCSKTSVVVDAATGQVVAKIANGDGVDAMGWDAKQRLLYIPAGRAGNVTIVHQDSPNQYTTVATVMTQQGARTLSVDPVKHVAYLFTPEYGPVPAGATAGAGSASPAGAGPPEGAPPGGPPSGRPPSGYAGPRGPLMGTWFLAISH